MALNARVVKLHIPADSFEVYVTLQFEDSVQYRKRYLTVPAEMLSEMAETNKAPRIGDVFHFTSKRVAAT